MTNTVANNQTADNESQPNSAALTVDESNEELPTELKAAIEAVLMVAERPVEPRLLAQLIETSVQTIETACARLANEYEAQERGFVLVRVAGGYRFQSHQDQAAYVERFVLEGQTSRLSAAALETLAIVAYKQPISRAQIAAIRGVSVDAVVRTLSQRGYIDEVSRDPGPGQAVLHGTTALFLENIGIDSLSDLPDLGEFVPAPDIVEALEHGLRFDDDLLEVGADNEAVIDVRDSSEGE
jgi:segregation and condensation protein B